MSRVELAVRCSPAQERSDVEATAPGAARLRRNTSGWSRDRLALYCSPAQGALDSSALLARDGLELRSDQRL